MPEKFLYIPRLNYLGRKNPTLSGFRPIGFGLVTYCAPPDDLGTHQSKQPTIKEIKTSGEMLK